MDFLTKIKFRAQNLVHLIFIEHFNLILCLLTLTIAGALAYRNTLGAPFIFDDLVQIIQNPNIQSWHWPWAFIENNRRPLLYATLAFNFYWDGFNVVGYHIFNIRVHIITAMVLFLLVRKTLSFSSVREFLRKDADLLALASSLIWLLHPIQTQAVTYIIQRAESLMGLFFLTALYCSSQYLVSRRIFWLIGAGVTALMAGLTKEVALVLPLMVLLYDRTFISKSFRTAIQRNCWLYSILSLTWGVMGFLYLTTRSEENLTAGFGMAGMTPWLYAINQPAVILHYLRIIVWPAPLIFDYQWPASGQLRWLLPSVCVVTSMVLVLGVMYRRFRVMGFLGLSFFILLIPSSSIIPLKDLIFEYRLYLSLSCVAVAYVLGLRFFVERFVSYRGRRAFLISFVAVVSLILGGLTYQRNKVYLSEESIWLDVIKKQPTNARAYNNLGEYWLRLGRDASAKQCFLKSIALDARYADVYANMATVLGREGKGQEAIEYAQQAIVVNPDFAVGYNNLGSAFSQLGRYAEAVPYFEKALALGFVREGVLINLAVALNNSGQPQKAAKVLKDALLFNPASSEVSLLLKEVLDKMKPY